MANKVEDLLRNGPIVVNIGVQGFAESVVKQGAPVVHVNWSPPAGGDQDMINLLDKLL